MTETAADRRAAALSPAKRALLQRRLAQQRAGAPLAPLPRTSGPGPFAVSFDQERLWLLEELGPGYVVIRALRVRGPLDVEALRSSLDALVERHEALRTRFRMHDGELVQEIVPPRPIDLRVVDLAAASGPDGVASRPADPLAAAIDELHAFAADRFELGSGLLLRATVLRLGDDDAVLGVVVHHLASDDGSKAVLFRELAALYRAAVTGEPAALPPLEHRYADFAVWQRQDLQGPRLQGLLDHWRHALDGAPAVLDLPTDRARPAQATGAGERTYRPVDADLVGPLDELARAEGATVFMVLLAAYAALLGRLTGSDDVVIGSPVAGRTVAGTEPLIGFFANTLVLRVDVSGDPTFRELVGRVREVVTAALLHQDLPFQRLVEELNPVRDLAVSPLFQVMITVEDGRPLEMDLPGCEVSVVPLEPKTAKYDWLLSVVQGRDHWELFGEWSADVLDRATVDRWLDWWLRLLERSGATPDAALSELWVLTDAEQDELRAWGTGSVGTVGPLVLERFDAVVAARPGAVAVECGDRRLTYRQLDEASAALAQHLAGLGVAAGDLVGVCVERGLDLPVALWGVLRAGAAYVPIDPEYPAERIAAIVEDAGVSVAVTHASVAGGLPEGVRTVRLDADDAEIAAAGAAAGLLGRPPTGPDDVAYVIFTSGSTGRPKGVRLPHRALANLLDSLAERPGFGPDDVLVGVTTPAFDLSVPDWFLPTTTGGRLVVAPRETAVDGRALAGLIAASGATVMQATPATWRLLIDSGWTGHAPLRIWCGGEAWSEQLAEQLTARGAELWNMYGPTETCVWSAARRLEPGAPVRIGGPLRNTRIAIVDERLQPVPPGCPGELCISGSGVALGYQGRPELTADRFVTSHSIAPGQSDGRLYRTGDLARWRRNGTIEFLGRLDHQVKLRGHRIELGEIEAELARQPGVGAAVVVLSTRRVADGELVAYVEAAAGRDRPVTAALRTALGEHLPAYMLPSAFVVLDALPLSGNGKIDRGRLPDPDGSHLPRPDERDAPHDLLEQTIAAIWQEVLQRDAVGRSDNFFDLGGHSLSAVRMFAEIEQRCGVRLPLATIFKGATVASLAGEVRAHEGDDEPWRSLVLLKPGTSTHPFFLFPMVGGEVFSWKDLVRNMAPEQVVYGLQSLGLDGRRWSHRTLPAMAAHFIDEMRTVQPHGPYLLGGFCFGGAVALEVAHQLAEAGEETGLLALVDVSRHVADVEITGIQSQRRKWAKFRREGKGGLVAWVLHRANNARLKLVKAAWWALYDAAERHDRQLPRQLHKVRWVNQRAIHAWTAPPSPTRVTLFRRASLHDEDSFYQGAVRNKLASQGLDERIMGGDDVSHVDMIREPAVRELAAAVTLVLAEATDRAGGVEPVPTSNTSTTTSAAPTGVPETSAPTTTRLEAT